MNQETILQNQIIVALCASGCVARNHTVGNFWTGYGGRVNVGSHGDADIWGHSIHGPISRSFWTRWRRQMHWPVSRTA